MEIKSTPHIGTTVQITLPLLKRVKDAAGPALKLKGKDSGIRAAGQILGKHPEIKIIILTVYEEDDLIFSAFQLCACDYILKNAPNVEILSAVKAAFHGISPIRPEIAGRIRNEFRRVKTYESGFTRQQICESRCVEMSTVKSQVHRILKKFGKKKITAE